MSERVLVTGGAGFIGSHLVDRLLMEGAHVTVIDDLSTGSERNLAQHSSDPLLTFVRGSILDPSLVDDLVSDCSLVFHLAATVGVRHIVEDPVRAMLTNVRGTEHVLQSAYRHSRRLLLASSSEVYWLSAQVPLVLVCCPVLGPPSILRL